jgi:hypothetical protein
LWCVFQLRAQTPAGLVIPDIKAEAAKLKAAAQSKAAAGSASAAKPASAMDESS